MERVAASDHASRLRATLVVLSIIALIATIAPPSPASAAKQNAYLDNLVNAIPSDFTPHILDGRVYSVAEVGNRIVVAGTFTQYRAFNSSNVITDRPYIFAFNRFNGAIDPNFRPQFDAEIEAIVDSPDGQSLYVGGVFREVNGVPKRNVVKLNSTTGAEITDFQVGTAGRVRHMVLREDRLLISGVFSEVNGTPRQLLAEVDPVSGELRDGVDFQFADHKVTSGGAGRPSVLKFDISPDGSTLVGVGNFGSVDGLQREQIVMIDLLSNPARIEDWHTREYRQRTTNPTNPVQNWCSSSFASYMRDVDIAPDGSYFSVNTTGAARYPRLCDTSTRWDLTARGNDLLPEWINYTGGDTLYANAITGPAIYIGGHFRWLNNPFGSDTPGNGSVPRSGIAAIDARNGLPFTWNPGRSLGVGVFDLLATDQGLWMGHDTGRVAWRQRPRITHFPTQSGSLPADSVGPIPGDLYSAPLQGAANPAFLHRVNAGGAALSPGDSGIPWAADTAGSPSPYRVAGGGSTSTFSGTVVTDSSVPAVTPTGIFNSYRWDPPAPPEMRWAFPVASGREVDVRLYFHTSFAGTSGPGQRVFDVTIDGNTVLEKYDIVAEDGFEIGTMKEFRVTSDGTIDIEFLRDEENPLISAIEIVDPTMLSDVPEGSALTRRSFDGQSFGPDQAPNAGGFDWALARGAFMLSGTLYTGWANGQLYAQTFDGTNFGAREQVDLRGLSTSQFNVGNLTSMAYDEQRGRIYYTLQGQNNLYYRYFTHESQVVGAEQYTAVSGTAAGINWSNVRGMHLDISRGELYLGATNGDLRRAEFAGGRPVTGTLTSLSGPGIDGRDWSGRALFTYAQTGFRTPNVTPTAKVRYECELLTCRFASTGSSDPDGWIDSFSWSTSDGGAGSDQGFTHTFGSQGTYEVTLAVTDNEGATGTETVEVQVADPIAVIDVQCDALDCSFDGTNSVDVDDGIEEYLWTFGDGTSATGATAEHSYGAAGTYEVTLEVVNEFGNSGTASRSITLGAPRNDITFLGSDTASGNRSLFQVDVPANVRPGDTLLLWSSSNRTSVGTPAPTGVANWTQLDSVVSQNNLRSTLWHKIAEPGDEGTTITLSLEDTSKTEVALLAYGGVDAETPLDAYAGAAETVYRDTHTTPQVVTSAQDGVIVSHWSDRTSGTTSWVTPAGDTVRYLGVGVGPGRISATATEAGPVAAGLHGNKTATASTANNSAAMWTVALAPRGFEPPEAVGPVAQIAADCDELACDLTAAGSAAGSSDIVDYSWDLGDGNVVSGIEAEIDHTYATPGVYEVSVLVTDANGLSDTATLELTAIGATVAAIETSCDELQCVFDGSSSAAGSGSLVAYEWEFSDETTDDGEVVSKTFAEAGTYTVTLTVRDDDGNSATTSTDINVAEALDGIAFLGESSATGNRATFQVAVPDAIRPGDSLLLWASSNRTAVGTPAPTGVTGWEQVDTVTAGGDLRTTLWHKVAEPGDEGATVTLAFSTTAKTEVALLGYGGTDPQNPIDAVRGVPETTTRAQHTTPEVVTRAADGLIVSYWTDRTSGTESWDTPGGEAVRYLGVGVGPGRVTATATDAGPVAPGLHGAKTAVATVANNSATMWTVALAPRGFEPPDAVGPLADASATCAELTCSFTAAGSTAGDAPIVSYEWDLGDGTAAEGSELEHGYAEAGVYDVTLTVTDQDGLSDAATIEVTAIGAAVASIEATCEELICTFDGSASTGGAGALVAFDWEFSDGAVAEGAVVEKAFEASGNYTATLTVRDEADQTATTSTSVSVVASVDGVEQVAAVGHNRNQTGHNLTIPANVVSGDGLILVLSVASSVEIEEMTDADRWELLADETNGSLRTWAWQSVAGSDDAGSQVMVRLTGSSKADLSMYAYRGTSPDGPVTDSASAIETVNRADHTTPPVEDPVPGARVLSYWADRSSTTVDWLPPIEVVSRHVGIGTGGGRVTALAVEQTDPAAPYGGLTARAVASGGEDSSSLRATMLTFVIGPDD